MTKSPLAVARKAMAVAQKALPPYSSDRSRKGFSQPQLFAALALRQFFKTDSAASPPPWPTRPTCGAPADWREFRTSPPSRPRPTGCE
jgi:hypothetical protein